MNENKVTIQFEHVSKKFPKSGGLFTRRKWLNAVSDVTFDISPGEALAIVGESGCGKTTMAKMITKLLDPTSGKIFVDGRDVSHGMSPNELKAFRSKVQIIFQDPFGSLNIAHKTRDIVGRAVEIHNPHLSRHEVDETVFDIFEKVGLTPAEDYMEKYPNQLSGGQRQRIVIARAIAVNPSIIVADEPTSMLDVSIGIDIMNLLLKLKREENLTFMYITHNLASARYMAERIIVMYAGNCVEIGDINEVIQEPYHPYTVLLLASTPEPFREEEYIINASEQLPDLTDESPRCLFADRCPKVMDICRQQKPPIVEFQNRKVMCFLYADQGEQPQPQSLCAVKDYA
ncbi:MAG: ABC transporter ATP-binding protein [Anaerolineales bacterium]|nr:ABC transporter ATP-binding protein [Anaerolineales bacterium]